jgi:hypothetical protein
MRAKTNDNSMCDAGTNTDEAPMQQAEPAPPVPRGPRHAKDTPCLADCDIINCEEKFGKCTTEFCGNPCNLLLLMIGILLWAFACYNFVWHIWRARYITWDASAPSLQQGHYLPGELGHLCYDDRDRNRFDDEHRKDCSDLINALYCHSLPPDEPELWQISHGNKKSEPTHDSQARLFHWSAAVEMCAINGRGWTKREDREFSKEDHRRAAWNLVHRLLGGRVSMSTIANIITTLGVQRSAWQQISSDIDGDGYGNPNTKPCSAGLCGQQETVNKPVVKEQELKKEQAPVVLPYNNAELTALLVSVELRSIETDASIAKLLATVADLEARLDARIDGIEHTTGDIRLLWSSLASLEDVIHTLREESETLEDPMHLQYRKSYIDIQTVPTDVNVPAKPLYDEPPVDTSKLIGDHGIHTACHRDGNTIICGVGYICHPVGELMVCI